MGVSFYIGEKVKPMRSIILLLIFISSLSMHAQDLSVDDKVAIENVLVVQEDAWNRGDVEAFMEGYWQSEELTFVGFRQMAP